MKQNRLIAMRLYCDRVTKNGTKLSIAWDGGNDSGWFALQKNDEVIEELTPIQEEILMLARRVVGYGSFAGDFTTTGEAVYNREEKSFVGQDDYSQSDTASLTCQLGVEIPDDIWFDRLDMEIDGDHSIDVTAQFIIMNGPYTHIHKDWEKKLKEVLTPQIENAVYELQEYSGIREEISIPYADFELKKRKACYCIDTLSYSYYQDTTTNILISLNHQNETYES